jgi:hypothetical protein
VDRVVKKAGTYQIPFCRHGDRVPTYSMMEYTRSKPGEVPPADITYRAYLADEWRDNLEFDATVEMCGHYRGRSAARVRVRNVADKTTYSMGLAGFYDAVLAFGVCNGKIKGRWTFVKQGTNYALAPVTKE